MRCISTMFAVATLLLTATGCNQTMRSSAEVGGAAQIEAQSSQAAYRHQLLQRQLEQSQLDLQSASTPEERKSIQQRIAMIQNQLDAVRR